MPARAVGASSARSRSLSAGDLLRRMARRSRASRQLNLGWSRARRVLDIAASRGGCPRPRRGRGRCPERRMLRVKAASRADRVLILGPPRAGARGVGCQACRRRGFGPPPMCASSSACSLARLRPRSRELRCHRRQRPLASSRPKPGARVSRPGRVARSSCRCRRSSRRFLPAPARSPKASPSPAFSSRATSSPPTTMTSRGAVAPASAGETDPRPQGEGDCRHKNRGSEDFGADPRAGGERSPFQTWPMSMNDRRSYDFLRLPTNA